jgi:hypothetical protein
MMTYKPIIPAAGDAKSFNVPQIVPASHTAADASR